MKPLFCNLLAIILSLSAWTSAGAFTVNGLNYSVKDGVATLTGATSRSITSLTVPATVTYNGTTYPINFIHQNAFDNYTSLRSVRFEESDTYIGCPWESDVNGFLSHTSPFENCPVEEYYFGRNLAELYSNKFSGDNIILSSTADNVRLTFAGKTTAILTKDVLYMRLSASKVTELTLGGDITKFYSSDAFADCSNLKTLTLLDGSYTLPSGLFPSAGIYSLVLTGTKFTKTPYSKAKHVTFGEGWVNIPDDFFKQNSSIQTVSLPSSLKSIGKTAFDICRNLEKINFPDSLVSVGGSAFYACSKLGEVVFGNNLKNIGSGAFQSCKGLRNIIIPGSVTKIGDSAFNGCDSVKVFTFASSTLSIEIGSAAFNIDLDSLIMNRIIPSNGGASPKHVVFGEGWENIPGYFFDQKYSIQAVSLPSSLKTIGMRAFYACSKLEKINFPDSLVSVGRSAFGICGKLGEVVFGNNLKDIGVAAFQSCKGLRNIIIPGSVTKIGDSAFNGCDSVKVFTFASSTLSIEIGSAAFNIDLDSLIMNRIIPSNGGASPKHVVFGEGWENIPNDFFNQTRTLLTVSLPSSLKSIGKYAFNVCYSLQSIVTSAKTPPTCGSSVFSTSIYPKAVLTVPMGSRRKYAAAEVWKNFANIRTEGALLVTVDYDHAKGEVTLNGEAVDSLELDEGEALDVAVNPATGFDVESVTANGEDCTDRLVDGVLHYDEISDTLALAVKFAPIMFDITIPAEIEGGHIEVNGSADAPAPLQYGSRVELRPVADEGYLLKTMSVNGSEVTLDADSLYVIDSLTENIAVDAVFEIIRYKATAKYDSAMGAVTLNGQTGDILVDYGTSLTIVAMPADGHYVGELKVNGAAVNHDKLTEPIIIERVTEDVAVEVDFDIYRYAVTATYDNTLGSVSINGSEGSADVDWGADAAVVITPAYGYQIATVELDGIDVTDEVNADGLLTIKSVKADHSVAVTFEVKRVRLSIAMEGGALMTIHDFGTEINYIPVPENGWSFHSATVGGEVITELEKDGSFKVGPLTDDTTVSVVFKNSTMAANSLDAETITVTVHDHTVVIAGAPDEAIAEVYDAAGLRYYSGLERSIALDNAGVYIVTVAGQSFKVLLR